MNEVDAMPLCAGGRLPPRQFLEVRRKAIFGCCKWDPQVGDTSTLADFPLILTRDAWRELAALTESLAAETLAAERELSHRPDLVARLGLPRKLARLLAADTRAPQEAARLMRFDFHWTSTGWHISEVNSDVPGGFVEASGFSRLIRDSVGELELAGDPVGAYTQAIAGAAGYQSTVALVHATAFSDDRQVMEFLAARLQALGIHTAMVAPDHLSWRDNRASLNGRQIAVAVRFYPAEWLFQYTAAVSTPWLRGSSTPLSNPATALLAQSKRLALVWDQLDTPMPMWRALLPATRAARRFESPGSDWVFKPALGRVGDGIWMEGGTPAREAPAIRRALRWFPAAYIAQQRFHTLPVQTPDGPRYPCLGVYAIDGKAAGIYGRISPTPLVNHEAQDIAVLLEDRPARSKAAEFISMSSARMQEEASWIPEK